METMGDDSVRDTNTPGCRRGIVVGRAIIQRRKIQTGLVLLVLGIPRDLVPALCVECVAAGAAAAVCRV